MRSAYRSLVTFGEYLASPFLLICRLYWGILFISAGLDKMEDIKPFINFLEESGLAFPTGAASLVALIEGMGGLCLLLGIGARLASLLLIFVMVGAYAIAHTESLYAIFHHPSVFVGEAPFNFMFAAFIVLIFGPGFFSIDALFERHLSSDTEEPDSLPKE